MLFLSLQCRSFSVADPDSHFPLHLHHIQEKILEPPGAVYLQESIFISHWHMSIHLQGESVEAGCSSVGSSAWITEHYWCVVECGEGAPVSFAGSATAESKKSHQSANEGFVSPASEPVKCIVLYSLWEWRACYSHLSAACSSTQD